MRILHVIGTRPNFVKTAPVIAAITERLPEANQCVVHTGQHYDAMMSEIFFEELGVPEPDHLLEVGSASHAVQTARVMERLEPVLEAERPDLVLVPGDVNSTLAAALCAVKLGIGVGHIESGLRSFDRTMPEEVNRVLVDQVAGLLFTHSEEARVNLEREGVAGERIHFVGNTMIDTLVALRERIEAADGPGAHGLQPGEYLLVTLHRPALVDGPLLAETIARLAEVAEQMPVLFPVHPRTRARIAAQSLDTGGLTLAEPVGYLEFLSLISGAAAVLTDSGGIQEETTYLGVPCFTLRDNTERPVTVSAGTNTLLGLDPSAIATIPARLVGADAAAASAGGAESAGGGRMPPPPLWDGRAAERLADVIAQRA
ncbi:MAG TPA: UDP-N-acetylglucosamine 2-epimerase (non-hydrolyzing) [Solirubrobacterales bacterium]|nr:UDP-N-acetylglucosamine 2-epimerase (non-hydrolyzing) [Solirubrobacterales bacterium]